MNIEYKTTDCHDWQIGDPLDAIGSDGYSQKSKKERFLCRPFLTEEGTRIFFQAA
jgi:hypothetical protein